MDSDKTIHQLSNGRKVRRDITGRWRDVSSGKWVSTEMVQALKQSPPEDGSDRNTAKSEQELIKAAVLQAAHGKGLPAESPEEVFAGVIGVQTAIALDPNNPGRATAAARFITKETNIRSAFNAEQDADRPWFVLGRELAGEVLGLIEEEQARRGEEDRDQKKGGR